MSEPFDSLIFDRNQSDVDHTAELRRKMQSGETLTTEEQEEYFSGLLKGSYNVNDMNRVDAAVRELGGLLTEAGYPVEYVDPSPDTPSGGSNEIVLTASDFQSGFLYYASGNHSPSDNYLCTQTFIAVQPNVTVAVRTNASLSADCGFIWYDSNKSYIGGTTGGVSTLWNSCFQAIPPTGTAYCKFNLNIPDIAGGDPGEVIVRQCENPEEQGAPNGYTQTEYIESDGSQYIDTGFKANQDTRIVFDADVLEVTSTATGLFGCRDKIGSNGFYIFEITSSSGNYNDGYGNSYTTSIELPASGKHKIDKNKNITYIDETVGYTYSTQTLASPVTVTLFTVNQSSGVDERMSKLKLYSCVIYDNDIIVRYYIPCVNEFGTVGLYDTVSGAFFRDANSSSVEPVVLPDGYTQVEYIQSSADGGQYIDAGFTPSSNTRVVATISDFPRTKTNQTIFGSRTQAGSSDAFMFLTTSQNVYRTDFGSGVISYSTSVSFDGMLAIDKNKNVTTLNGGNTVTATNSTFAGRYTMRIFVNGGGGDKFYAKGVKLYSFKAYSNDTLIRDFIPCKNSSGEVGLYDLDGGEFYANEGTGSFTAGRAISDIGFAHGNVVPRPSARDYWVVGDIISQTVWAQYIQNVQNVRDAYYTMSDSPELPTPTAPLTYDGANAIEKLLYDISRLYDAMKKMYRICGTFNASNDYLRQYIRSI